MKQQQQHSFDLPQLESLKRQLLKQLPANTQLNSYLTYLCQKLDPPSTLTKIKNFVCCKTEYSNSHFKEAFQLMSRREQKMFYEKSVIYLENISKKKMRIDSVDQAQLQETGNVRQIDISFKEVFQCKEWDDQQIIISCDKKTCTLGTSHRQFNFHNYLMHVQKQLILQDQFLVFEPLGPNLQRFFIKNRSTEFKKLYTIFQKLANICMIDNLQQMIGKDFYLMKSQDGTELDEKENALFSERSLKEDSKSCKLIRKMTREMRSSRDKRYFLRWRHPVQPQDRGSSNYRLLCPQKQDVHYYFENQWQISQQGKLIAINQQKLDKQSGVVKYILKRLLKGDEMLNISLPVSVFNGQSNLSLLLNSYRFAPQYLQKAASTKSPLQRFKKVIKFALSSPCCYIKLDKPFNPILGETYQCIVDGTTFYGQQISHHPPISSIFVKGRGYTLYGNLQAEVNIGFNSAGGNNRGWVYVAFEGGQQKVRFTNASGEMGGLVFGKRNMVLKDSIYVVDQKNLLFCEIKIGKVKLQKKVEQYYDSVQGQILKLKQASQTASLFKNPPATPKKSGIQKMVGLINGRWLSKVYFDQDLLLDTLHEHPPQIQSYEGLLDSDVSLRDDMMLYRIGKMEECQVMKEEMEERQRKDGNLRSKGREK